MKRYIKNLFYSSVMIIASIGISSDTEARVTKEVAEAVLQYLMKAAGIQEDTRPASDPNPTIPYYIQDKKDAIISMIYTDAGQQQMVKWAKNGEFPAILTRAGFSTENLYLGGWLSIPLKAMDSQTEDIDTLIQNLMAHVTAYPMVSYAVQTIRDAYIGSLFPCGPGTFSSFAAHPSRLGYYALTKGFLEKICAALLTGQNFEKLEPECVEIIKRLRSLSEKLDNKLISIIFVLDICDDFQQIKNILGHNVKQINVKCKYNEYDCRPVSATASELKNPRQGDCVETLLKHIIAIAIQQNDGKYLTQNLPEGLKKFFKTGVSGEMNLNCHYLWKNALTHAFLHSGLNEKKIKDSLLKDFSLLDFQKPTLNDKIRETKKDADDKISKGTVENIVSVLEAIAFFNKNEIFVLKDNAKRLEDSLNQLAINKTFGVKILDTTKLYAHKDIPSDITTLIEITDNKLHRLITIGIWGQKGHAEIISIKKLTFAGFKPGFLLNR